MDDFHSRYQVVDLSHPLHEGVPTWSGHCGFRLEQRIDYDQGLRVHTLKCHAGVGTHMDAPSHFIPGGLDIDKMPLEKWIAPICLLDLRHEMGADLSIQPEHIQEYERKYGALPSGAFLIAWTGWGQFWKTPQKYRNSDASGKLRFPGFSSACAEKLAKRSIAGIGIDTLSPDGGNDGFPVHLHILGAGKYILENLTGLHQLPPKGATLLAFPIPYIGGTEAPVRAIALIPRK